MLLATDRLISLLLTVVPLEEEPSLVVEQTEKKPDHSDLKNIVSTTLSKKLKDLEVRYDKQMYGCGTILNCFLGEH